MYVCMYVCACKRDIWINIKSKMTLLGMYVCSECAYLHLCANRAESKTDHVTSVCMYVCMSMGEDGTTRLA